MTMLLDGKACETALGSFVLSSALITRHNAFYKTKLMTEQREHVFRVLTLKQHIYLPFFELSLLISCKDYAFIAI